MSRRARAVLLGAVLLGAMVSAAGCAAPIVEPAPDGVLAGPPRAEVLLGGSTDADAVLRVLAVVADTPEARARGLMGVDEVPEGTGMLFAFPDATGSGRPGFWMLDTRVALDIAFAIDGVVVGVATMLPCAAAPCPVTHPGVDYDVALEVAAGVLTRAGIVPGDRFVWRVEDGSGSGAGAAR